VQKTMNAEDIIEDMVGGFASLLQSLMEENRETSPELLSAYVMGFAATLKALGFPNKDGRKLTLMLHDEIVRVGTEGCGECEHCRAKKK